MNGTRLDQLEAKAWEFHEQHPSVWVLFTRFTREKIDQGFTTYSAYAIFERIRWETDTPTRLPDAFKLNNNHRPFYARWWMNANPEHDGFFRIRKQTSEHKPATDLPELGPEDYEYLN